jgi:23S rRNA (cytidine1920-2'-O)/16S rRNA (cytidine1409-2'-O)-methyltransferase
MEKTNFRYLDPQAIAEKADIAVMDVSFISVLKLSDNLSNFLKEDGRLVILIKPQFEAEKGQVSKGVITDKNMHAAIVGKVIDGMAEKKYALQNLTTRRSRGRKGILNFWLSFHRPVSCRLSRMGKS